MRQVVQCVTCDGERANERIHPRASGNDGIVALTSTPNDLVVALAVTPKAAGAARRLLVREGLDPDLDHTVCLLTSEIVTNAIQHSGMGETERLVVAARLTDDFARVE